MQPDTPEVWLRGPLEGVPPLLQPVGHALLQALEEVNKTLSGFPEELLWERPAGVASVGFHLQHLTGVLDRLFTYAKGLSLTPEQLTTFRLKKFPPDTPYSVKHINSAVSITRWKKPFINCVKLPNTSLLQPVGVGRKKLPSTVLGLLFHAAEHTQRHTGQLLVTVRVLRPADHH